MHSFKDMPGSHSRVHPPVYPSIVAPFDGEPPNPLPAANIHVILACHRLSRIPNYAPRGLPDGGKQLSPSASSDTHDVMRHRSERAERIGLMTIITGT